MSLRTSIEHSAFAVDSGVVRASAVQVTRIEVYNDKASIVFFQVFDLAAVPANTTVPTLVYPVAADSKLVVEFNEPARFATGCVYAQSTTLATKTLDATDDISVQVFTVQP